MTIWLNSMNTIFELWVEDNGLTGMTLKEIEEYFAKKNNRGE